MKYWKGNIINWMINLYTKTCAYIRKTYTYKFINTILTKIVALLPLKGAPTSPEASYLNT